MVDKYEEIINKAYRLLNDRIEALEASSASHTEVESWKTKVFKLDEEIAELRENYAELNLDINVELTELKSLITHSMHEGACIKLMTELRESIKNVDNHASQGRTELKERVEGIYKSVHGIAPDQADVITEVLRDYMKYMKNFNPQSWEEVNKLLAKLDGKTDCSGICGFCEIKETCTNPKRLKQMDAEKFPEMSEALSKLQGKTEKKEFIPKKRAICLQCRTKPYLIQDCENKDRWYCPQCDYEWNKKKASGGEKETTIGGLGWIFGKSSMIANSKPPELNDGKDNEPREDDLCPICGKFLDGDKEWNDYAHSLIPVKREDLKMYRFQLFRDNNHKMVEHIDNNYLKEERLSDATGKGGLRD